ncbi:hypothetical protein UVI_02040630 [Ustilaginoidea virens]|uniref:Mannose-1-phosphate guanyltransferase n=1 Tax=Ustilaginoidea virens TaxID=1159556 RepID=A0A1B5L7A2_USTVR|nr:hypothetical protein UVI_02040630 [Ustilaginoidea virens]
MAVQTGIEAALAKIMEVVQKQDRRDSSGLGLFTPGADSALRSFSPHPMPKLSPAMRYIPPPSPSPQLTVPAMDREIPGFYVIIPAGGAGTRLWPLSRENHPKFLLDIDLSGRSLLQSTWNRLVPLAGCSRMTVVAGPSHSESIQKQLPQLEASNLFTEPGPKDSMAAIGLAAAILQHRDGDAVIGSFAADHMIAGEDAFLNSVTEAVKVAKEGFLVTIGIAPSHPATGFGYVKLGDKLDVPNAPSARLVSSFKEKPDAYTAAKYVSSGIYRWNAGMFVTKASTLMSLVKEYEPELHANLTRIAEAWEDKAQRDALLTEVGLLKLRNQRPKYQITHPSGRIAKTDNVVLKLHYNVQPWVGLLTWNLNDKLGYWEPMAGGVSDRFELPATKVKDASKNKAKKA